MSVTATIHIQHDRLGLIPTLQKLDGVEIQVITQVNTDPEVTNFPFLIEYPDREELEAVLDTDPTIESYKMVDWMDDAGIYYLEHTTDTKFISTVVTDVKGFLIHAKTKDHGWLVRLLLPDREALNAVWEYAGEEDITLDIIEMYGDEYSTGGESYGLTDEQRTALQTAYRMGYFHEPREASLEELATEMELSSTAISGRLRRGMRNLIAATLAEDPGEQ